MINQTNDYSYNPQTLNPGNHVLFLVGFHSTLELYNISLGHTEFLDNHVLIRLS